MLLGIPGLANKKKQSQQSFIEIQLTKPKIDKSPSSHTDFVEVFATFDSKEFRPIVGIKKQMFESIPTIFDNIFTSYVFDIKQDTTHL